MNSTAESLIHNTWRPYIETVSPCDPLTLRSKNHPERLKEAQQRTGLQDAVFNQTV
jgi:acetyl-CoA carboxylase beta subunit